MAYIEIEIENHNAFLNTEKVMYVKENRPGSTAIYLVDGSKVTVSIGVDELMSKIRMG